MEVDAIEPDVLEQLWRERFAIDVQRNQTLPTAAGPFCASLGEDVPVLGGVSALPECIAHVIDENRFTYRYELSEREQK
jgi:hypothetical protein